MNRLETPESPRANVCESGLLLFARSLCRSLGGGVGLCCTHQSCSKLGLLRRVEVAAEIRREARGSACPQALPDGRVAQCGLS